MADLFCHSEAKELLKNKHIILVGDSNMRALYKDLVLLLNENSLITQANLRRKQEQSFCGDELGKHSELYRGREYQEERSFQKGGTRVDFIFITRCYNPVLEDMIEDIHLGTRQAPDIIYMNSTLWDVNRWGPYGVVEFKDNLQKLARLFKSSLPPSTLVIWATALPVSPTVESSLLIDQLKFLGHTLRFDVMEANQFARQVMVSHGFDVIDNHFHMRMQTHRRLRDGIHYEAVAMRLLTNLLLTHIALSWGVPLPNRRTTVLQERAQKSYNVRDSSVSDQLKSLEMLSSRPEKPNNCRSPTRDPQPGRDYKWPRRRFVGGRNDPLSGRGRAKHAESVASSASRQPRLPEVSYLELLEGALKNKKKKKKAKKPNAANAVAQLNEQFQQPEPSDRSGADWGSGASSASPLQQPPVVSPSEPSTHAVVMNERKNKKKKPKNTNKIDPLVAEWSGQFEQREPVKRSRRPKHSKKQGSGVNNRTEWQPAWPADDYHPPSHRSRFRQLFDYDPSFSDVWRKGQQVVSMLKQLRYPPY